MAAGLSDGDTLVRHMLTYETGYNVGRISYEVADGQVSVFLPANSAILLATDRV